MTGSGSFAVATMLLADGDKCTKTPAKSTYLRELGLSFKKNKNCEKSPSELGDRVDQNRTNFGKFRISARIHPGSGPEIAEKCSK